MAETSLDTVDSILDTNRLIADPRSYIESLDEDGTLAEIFPSLAVLKGVTQSPIKHAEGDAFEHTLMVLDTLMGETPSDEMFGPIIDEHYRLLMIFAALYHDTGKRERNRDSTPENKVDHVKESMFHARVDLANLLSEEDLALVVEMIEKHEWVLSDTLSKKLNRLHQLFALQGNLDRGRMLLKFSEADYLGRRIAGGNDHLERRRSSMLARNLGLYGILLEYQERGETFPVNRISVEVRGRILEFLELV